MRPILFPVLFLVFTLPCAPAAAQDVLLHRPDHWMAVVGDSGVTGAVTSPDIEATVGGLVAQLWQAATEPAPSTQITRIPFAPSEATNILARTWARIGARLSRQLDVPENSFAFRIGQALNIDPHDIVLVGQDGVQVHTIPQQFERIYQVDTPTLPPLILLSFTANDMCDVELFHQSIETIRLRFQTALEKAWEAARPFLKPHRLGTKIIVLAPFDVVGVISNPQILKQRVNVEGQGEITCGQLRHGETKGGLGAWFILRTLNMMCPSVTSTHLDDVDKLQRLRDTQEAFSQAWKARLEKLNHEYKNIEWIYLESMRRLEFTTGDVASDCFHPSARGHLKAAALILKTISPSN